MRQKAWRPREVKPTAGGHPARKSHSQDSNPLLSGCKTCTPSSLRCPASFCGWDLKKGSIWNPRGTCDSWEGSLQSLRVAAHWLKPGSWSWGLVRERGPTDVRTRVCSSLSDFPGASTEWRRAARTPPHPHLTWHYQNPFRFQQQISPSRGLISCLFLKSCH